MWGYQVRNDTASGQCGICSDGHPTDCDVKIRNRKNMFRCPNYSGNPQVYHSRCLARPAAVNKPEWQMGHVVHREGGLWEEYSPKARKDKKMEKKPGVP
jgi:hypothetical protein